MSSSLEFNPVNSVYLNLPKFSDFLNGNVKICIVGLGYVGLPLAVMFARKFKIIGFDVSEERVRELQKGFDKNNEIDTVSILNPNITYTSSLADTREAALYIITVPTPTTAFKIPDLSYLRSAAGMVAQVLKKGDGVVIESTVYPGCTEEFIIPILEDKSGLKWGRDFWVGYSPERINPGDKEHYPDKVVKVVSADSPATLDLLASIYGEVIEAGVHRASSIKVAEACKILENTQRDVNIALVNEFAMFCEKMDIDVHEVLKAASTKWNFLNFEPGLVGGHCIPEDPYYLIYKAQNVGFFPQVAIAARRVNEEFPGFVASKVVKLLVKSNLNFTTARVLVLGITFKANVNDVRNTKVVDLIHELENYGCNVDVTDPLAIAEEVKSYYGLDLISWDNVNEERVEKYDAVVLAVKHDAFRKLDRGWFEKVLKEAGAIVDIKGVLTREKIRELSDSFNCWRF